MKCICGHWERRHKIVIEGKRRWLVDCMFCDCDGFKWKSRIERRPRRRS